MHVKLFGDPLRKAARAEALTVVVLALGLLLPAAGAAAAAASGAAPLRVARVAAPGPRLVADAPTRLVPRRAADSARLLLLRLGRGGERGAASDGTSRRAATAASSGGRAREEAGGRVKKKSRVGQKKILAERAARAQLTFSDLLKSQEPTSFKFRGRRHSRHSRHSRHCRHCRH
jgi:hypothetical protein